MWKDDIDDVLKVYKRFLKDNGVYYRAMNIHLRRYTPNQISPEAFKKKVASQLDAPIYLISRTNVFCSWERSKEGEFFWWHLSTKWKIKCIEENIGINYGRSHLIDMCSIIRTFLNRFGDLTTPEEREWFEEKKIKFKKIYDEKEK